MRFLFLLLFMCFIQCKGTDNNPNKSFQKYLNLCTVKRYQNVDSLKQYLPTIDSLYTITKDDRFSWLSQNLNGLILTKRNEYHEAIKSFKKAMLIAEKLKIDTLTSRTYNYIGVCFKETGATDEAFDFIQKAIRISEQYDDQFLLTSAKINLANVYFNKGDLKQTKVTLDEVSNPLNPRQKLLHQHTLANYYGASGYIDSALMIDNSVIAMNQGKVNELHLSPFYNNKALCLLEKKQLDSAIVYLNKSYKVDSLNVNPKNMGANLLVLAEIFNSKGDNNNALNTNFRALTIFKNVDSKKNLSECFAQISKCHQLSSNWKLAKIYQDSAFITRNKYNSLSINNKIEALKIKHDVDKKDNIIENQESRLKLQRWMLLLLTLLSGLALTIYYLISKNLKNTKNFERQQILFDATHEAQSLERERIARDLHDSVGQKLSVVKMHMSMNPDMATNSFLLDEAIQDLREITHNLMPTDMSKGLNNAIKAMCDQINFANKIPKVQFVSNVNNVVNNLEPQKSLFIYRIVQELLNNSIKYASAKTINIEINREKNLLLLIFKDDGIGIDPSKLQETHGIGLSSIKKRIQLLHGNLNITSTKDNGVRFDITIPIDYQ